MPLHQACVKGHTDAIKLLIELGADIECGDSVCILHNLIIHRMAGLHYMWYAGKVMLMLFVSWLIWGRILIAETAYV